MSPKRIDKNVEFINRRLKPRYSEAHRFLCNFRNQNQQKKKELHTLTDLNTFQIHRSLFMLYHTEQSRLL